MKKYILLLASLVFAGAGMASAAEELANVDLTFCNGANHLEMTLDTGAVQTEICMHFSNVSPEPIIIDIGIVDGEFAQGGQPTQACKTSANGIFGNSIKLSGENVITIPPGQMIEKYATYTLVTGYAGVVHGCITYTISAPQTEGGTMSIIDRKANLVDIIVPGKVQSMFHLVPLSEVTSGPDALLAYGKRVAGDEMVQISDSRKEKTATILMGFENSGFVDEEYTVELTRTGLFGIFKKHVPGKESLLYSKEKILYQQSMDNVKWYEGWVKTSIVLNHRPAQFGENAEQSWETLSFQYGYLVTPWYILVAIGVGIIGLILLIRWLRNRRKKKHHHSSE